MMRSVAFALAFAAAVTIAFAGSAPVLAGVISSTPASGDMKDVEAKHNSAIVHARLVELGYSSPEADLIITQMTNEDLSLYAANPHQIQVSGIGGLATVALVAIGFTVVWVILLQLGINPLVD